MPRGGLVEGSREIGAIPNRGAIEALDVVKRFDGGILALDRVSFEAAPGEFIAVVGPSGCGKSTLLRLIAGLMPLTEGAIAINGREVREPRQDVALMLQQPTLLPWQTALENTLLPRKLKGGLDEVSEQEAYELLALVGLSGFEHAYPKHLSGGMTQRVALARLLMVGAAVLLLDEPFAATDQLTREHLNVELLKIHAETGATAVLVTHNITEAILLGDRVIVMTPRPGRVADVIDVPFERPRAPEMAAEPEFQQLYLRAYRGLSEPAVEDLHAARQRSPSAS